jgi:hypothetical protein
LDGRAALSLSDSATNVEIGRLHLKPTASSSSTRRALIWSQESFGCHGWLREVMIAAMTIARFSERKAMAAWLSAVSSLW